MTKSIADTIVSFIRVQEKADRLREKCDLILHSGKAARCHKEAERLQREADRLLAEYQSWKRHRRAYGSTGKPTEVSPSNHIEISSL